MVQSVQRRNFGRNQVLKPSAFYTPADEQEILQILDRHRGQRIRAVGRLHSWSDAVLSDDVLLDLRRLNAVQLHSEGDQLVAEVGAGCQIKRLLKELNRHDATLQSLGLITEQTIAGAISTGTHGSGRHSMSHYVEGVRLARYDASTGKVVIDELSAGEPLQAARCSLGSLGIILSVRIRCREQYNVKEHFTETRRLSHVLDAEASFPLQQFYLIPWRWSYFIQHRREDDQPRSRLARLYRIYWLGVMDYALHLQILLMERVLRSRRSIRFSFRHIVPAFLIRNWKVTDRSSSMLVMKHEAFRHIEIELFVPRDQLADALDFAQETIEVAGGRQSTLSADNQQRIEGIGMQEDLARLHDQYFHHYPICVRRVLPDDTLISMASGSGQDWYALSFISYAKPARRAGFHLFASFMARSMSRLFHARPHWGKICPLEADELTALYPRFDAFRTICNTLDPQGVFQNDWTTALLEADIP
ncbi:MAG: oxidoreductase [Methanobacteriota archaeon]|nr:MAG: oxidoreductase [Euryarchaeota archaeon]HIN04069.1 FAD-binding protein [Candidatus Poseidoniales archaeon]